MCIGDGLSRIARALHANIHFGNSVNLLFADLTIIKFIFIYVSKSIAFELIASVFPTKIEG